MTAPLLHRNPTPTTILKTSRPFINFAIRSALGSRAAVIAVYIYARTKGSLSPSYTDAVADTPAGIPIFSCSAFSRPRRRAHARTATPLLTIYLASVLARIIGCKVHYFLASPREKSSTTAKKLEDHSRVGVLGWLIIISRRDVC